MSLMDTLGYTITPQSGLRGRFADLATNETMNALIARTAMPLDRLMLRATGGRQHCRSPEPGSEVTHTSLPGNRITGI